MGSGSCATEGEKQIDNIHCEGLRRGIADCESTKDVAKKNQWHDEMITDLIIDIPTIRSLVNALHDPFF